MRAHPCPSNPPLRHSLRTACAVLAAPLLATPAFGGQLTYVPVNPSFGGNPLNGAYMLQSAQAQKRYPYPLDDLGLQNNGDFKILNAGNYPIIQVGNSVYIYDPAKGQWVPFDPDNLPAGTPSASADAITPTAQAQGPAALDTGVLK